jgi:hypothetical protein
MAFFVLFGGCKEEAPTTPPPTALASPTLVTPTDGAFVSSNAVRLAWTRIPSATLYQCQVSQTVGFATLEYDSTVVETTVVAVLASHFGDHWRVRAKHNSGVTGEWSSPGSFNRWIAIREGWPYDAGCNSVQQTADGGFIAAGYTHRSDSSLSDFYLIKTDGNGSTEWTRAFGQNNIEVGYCVQQTADGGFVVVGTSLGGGFSDVYLIKVNGNGNLVWSRTLGGNRGYSIQQTVDGGLVIAGSTSSSGAGGYDVCLIKTDANGNQLWMRTFGGNGYDEGYSVQQTADSGFIVAGSTSSLGAGGNDVYLIKTDANGDTLWTRTFGGNLSDVGKSVQQTTDRGYIIVGETFSFAPGFNDIYMLKTDASGNLLWTKTFGEPGAPDMGSSVRQTADGGYIITGGIVVFSPPRLLDVAMIKTDGNGNLQWSKFYGGSNEDAGKSVQQTMDGGYIVAGTSGSFGAVFLIKTDANGSIGH